jgi:hypothetical protein
MGHLGRTRAVAVLVVALAWTAGCSGASEDVVVEGAGDPDAPEVKVLDSNDAETDAVEHEYVVPLGTGDRIDAGEEVEIVPRKLEVKVGDSIRIVNDDVQGVNVGIFWVPAGRTATMEFTTPGTLTGECDVHPDGAFTIEVIKA